MSQSSAKQQQQQQQRKNTNVLVKRSKKKRQQQQQHTRTTNDDDVCVPQAEKCCIKILKSCKGKDGKNGKNGNDGEDGNDGLTPYIGPNDNWWIGDEDTGVSAKCCDNGPAPASSCSIENENDENLFVSVCDKDIGIHGSTSKGIIIHDNNTQVQNVNTKSILSKFPYEISGNQMWFNVEKGAFRTGNINNDDWKNTQVGEYSFASGHNGIANGQGAHVLGFFENTHNNDSKTEASGDGSMISGYNGSGVNNAIGRGSMILGDITGEVDGDNVFSGTNTTHGIGSLILGRNEGGTNTTGDATNDPGHGALILGYNEGGSNRAIGYGSMISGRNFNGTNTIGGNAYGSMISGYNSGTNTIGLNARGSMISGRNNDGTNTIKDYAYGSMISSYNNSGTNTIEENAYGSMISGYNDRGTNTIGEDAYGSTISGYNDSGTNTIGKDAYGSMIFGYVGNGEETNVSSKGSFSFGRNNTVAVNYSMATGRGLVIQNPDNNSNDPDAFSQGALVCGHYNQYDSLASNSDNTTTSSRLFAVGNGDDDTDRSNAFSVGLDGNTYTENSNFASATADYAEYFKSAHDREIPIGTSVVLVESSLEGDDTMESKVRPALPSDSKESIIGIVTATPSILANGFDAFWHGKYERDTWGRVIYETVEIEEKVPKSRDKKSSQSTKEEESDSKNSEKETSSKEKQEMEFEIVKRKVSKRKISPLFDPEKKYIPRSARSEWVAVGLLGQIRMHKGQPTRSSWIKIRDLGNGVELWFVR